MCVYERTPILIQGDEHMAQKCTTELLSPAGTWEALAAAVQNGADAVYIGGSAFSARAGAKNFDDTQLCSAVRYCHVRGVKVFVTLNTLIKENEFEDAVHFASFLRDIGTDGIIIQDFGLASFILKVMPDIRLHASTQMTVHSVSGAKALSELGFKRIVLARELSFEQIKQIKRETDTELEIFVHGAICCSYSGQCLLSSFLGGRSGNRGRCAQPCRLPYELSDKSGGVIKRGYLLSPKDMCLINHLGEIRETGIESLKIEGRLKKPEYVAAVTKIYRKYLDNPMKAQKCDMDTLLDAFNRSGFTDGYFTGKRGGQMMSFNSPSNISEEKFDKDIKKTFAENANFRRIDVRGECTLHRGEKSKFELSDSDGNRVCAYGAEVQNSCGRALEYERVYRQLSKFGSAPFELTDLKLSLDDNVIMPISEINALRREACTLLEEKRACVPEKKDIATSVGMIFPADDTLQWSAEVRTQEQAKAVLEYEPDRLYVPRNVADKLKGFTGKTEIVTKLGAIINSEDAPKIYSSIPTKGVMCSDLGSAYALSGKHDLYGSYRLNIYNSKSAGFYREYGFKNVTLSPELSLKDIAAMGSRAAGSYEVMVYGHIPLMTMKNCVIRSCSGKCGTKNGIYYLTDRMKERFAVLCEKESCTNLLLNPKPLYMADKFDELAQAGVKKYMLMFTVENEKECRRICGEYVHAIRGGKAENIMGENSFTRGHFYRGVK